MPTDGGDGARLTKNGVVARGLPVCVGLTTHGGMAQTSFNLDQGWISCWEQMDDSQVGTGVRLLDPLISVTHEVRSNNPDHGHILFLARHHILVTHGLDEHGIIHCRTSVAIWHW